MPSGISTSPAWSGPMFRWLIATLLAAFLVLTPSTLHADESAVPGEILLKIDGSLESPDLSNVRQILLRDHGQVIRTYTIVPGLNLVRFPPDQDVSTLISTLTSAPGVEYAEPNFYIWALGHVAASVPPIPPSQYPPIPAPVAPPTQWREDPELSGNYGVIQNGTNQVWSRIGWLGSPRTVIAVLDTGIDYTHPDLTANLWRNPKGPSDGEIGWDFVHDDGLPYDDYGHGTHVSGIAAAVGGNGIGISGQCPRCSIMAIKVMDAHGRGNDGWAIAGLQYALDHDASVINSSWGETQASQALYQAFAATSSAGIFNSVAAGNSGWDLDYSFYNIYPAKFMIPGLLSIAAISSQSVIPYWSDYGPGTVALSSAGNNVLSTVPGNRYALGTGTSMATPNITGCVALIRSYRPELTPEQIVQLLRNVIPDPSSARMTAFGGRPDMLRIFSLIR